MSFGSYHSKHPSSKQHLSHFFSLSPFLNFFFLALLVCFAFLFLASLAFCIALFNMFLFVYFSVLFYFAFHKYLKKMKKKKNSVFVFIGTCVPWMAIETKFFKFCVSCSLDQRLYAQLSK